jgi:ribosomal protein L11
MSYIVNWALSGFRDAEHKAGDIIEDVEHEAEQIADLVKAGVLTLISKAKNAVGEFDLNAATPAELVAYAKSKFDFDLDADLNKDAMLAEIASLEAGSDDDGQGSETAVADMTKAQLVEYAKTKHDFDLKMTLSRTAMLAEIASLEKA